MNPLISVIVPIYRVEKYLHRCIDSILAQTFTDFELLLIDDGSPDNCGKICDEYANKDKRIKVFHKENGGVCSARNLGLDKACGEWVMFIDSDDWINSNLFFECSKYISNNDIIRFSAYFVTDSCDINKNAVIINECDTRDDYLKLVISKQKIIALWACIYKRNIFIENNIRFDESLKIGEDWLVLVQAILHSQNVKSLNLPLYYYNLINTSSCSNSSKDISKILDIARAYHQIENYVIKHKYQTNELMVGKMMSISLIYRNLINLKIPISKIIEFQQDVIKLTGKYKVSDIFRYTSELRDRIILFASHFKCTLILMYYLKQLTITK
jgi:glycosyltransferase involved in cell wall biosynthesis